MKCAQLLTYVNSMQYKTELQRIITEKHPVFVRDLEIGGTDLVEMGITGVQTGQVISRLLEWVWENPHENKKEKLLKWVREEI